MLPAGTDPADFAAATGADAVREVIESAVPLLRFAIDRKLSAYDLDRPEQRAKALSAAAAVLAPVKESILRHDYANYIADRLFVDFDTAMRAVKQARIEPGAASHPELLGDGTDQPKRMASTPEERAEVELVALLVSRPTLRGGARHLLTENLLTSDEMRFVVELLADKPGLNPTEVMSCLAAECRDAVDMLSGAVVSEEAKPEDVVAARDLARKLKELDLLRRINAGKARLKRPDNLDAGAYDEVFREVSVLTMELDEVRRGIRDVLFE